MSQKLSPEYRLQGYSTEELVNAWELRATGICHGRKLNGRKLKPGPLLNALVLWFMSLDSAERTRIVDKALPMLEEHLTNRPDPPAEEETPPRPAVPVVNSAPKRKARR